MKADYFKSDALTEIENMMEGESELVTLMHIKETPVKS